ncbi:hypothetical protein EI555_002212 [Monodon monoceros]|uniref:Urotensin-2 n=1 Tax=Monodon monoceros TaxID=40151 RepID=A0A4U1FP73_MONMO|nr:hypothetical protein EI555_002212 [Monodon monoceros]
MYKLVSCCLLFIGCLNPLWSLPVLDSREEPLQLSGKMISFPYVSLERVFKGLKCNVRDKNEYFFLKGKYCECAQKPSQRLALCFPINVVAEDLEGLVKQVDTTGLPRSSDLPTAAPGQDCSARVQTPEDAESTLDELERASLLQMPPEMSGAETGDGLRKADLGTNIFYPRRSVRKAFSGQDPNILLSHLLARIRKPYKKRGTPSECFWKYCV